MITSSSRVSPVIITTRTVVSSGVELKACWGMVVVGKSTVATNGVVCWGMVVVATNGVVCWGMVVVATNGVVCWGMVVVASNGGMVVAGISRQITSMQIKTVNKITMVHNGLGRCCILQTIVIHQ